MLSRAILFLGACEIYGDKKNENGENYQRTKRVHAELHLVSRLVVDVEGKSLEIGGAYEMADDEVVKREREAHHKSRDDTRHYRRNFNFKEGLRGGTAKVKRRLNKMLVHLLELGQYGEDNVGQVEGNATRRSGKTVFCKVSAQTVADLIPNSSFSSTAGHTTKH